MRAPAAAFASVLSVRSSAKSVPTISAALMTMVATVAAGRSFDGAWYRPARRSRVCAHRSPSMHAGARNRLLRGGVVGAGLRRRVHRGDSLVSSAASSARMVARRSARRRRCGGGSARALANARGARRARRRAANRHRLSHSQARSRPARVRVSSPGLRFDPCGGFASPCTTMHIRSSGLPGDALVVWFNRSYGADAHCADDRAPLRNIHPSSRRRTRCPSRSTRRRRRRCKGAVPALGGARARHAVSSSARSEPPSSRSLRRARWRRFRRRAGDLRSGVA